MKYLISALFVFNSLSAISAPVTLEFNDAPLSDVVKVVYTDILKQPYSLPNDIQQKISLNISPKDNENLQETFDLILKNNGLTRTVQNGVNNFTKLQDTQQHSQPIGSYIYHAKHRPLNEFKVSLNATGALSLNTYDDLAFITGSPENLKIARYMIEQYDRPLSEIEIKTSIVEFNSANDSGLSFYFALKNIASGLSVTVGNPSALQNFITFGNSTFDALLSTIANDNKFNIVETSTIRVANGKVGRLNVGQEVPVLNQFTQDNQGRQIQSVTYRQSGLLVDIKPNLINGLVHATVNQQLSSFAITNTSTIDSPTLLKREINTDLVVPLNEVIVIGGLEDVKDTKAKSTFFGLPIGTQSNFSRSSLALIIQFSSR